MFLQKYKGLILGIVGAVLGVISFVYLKDLDYIYKTGLKLLSVTLIVIGWGIACDSTRFYKKRIIMYRCYYSLFIQSLISEHFLCKEEGKVLYEKNEKCNVAIVMFLMFKWL